MDAYIRFTNCSVMFTPNSITHDHEHVVINVSAPAFPRRHQHNIETGRRETLIRIPYDFTGEFTINVTTDYRKRRKSAARLHRLGVSVEKGIIVGVINLDNDRVPFVEVGFPSGYWGELGTNWEASDWEVWVDLPSGWDEE